MSLFVNADGGLTTVGIVVTAVVIFAILVLLSLKKSEKLTWGARRLTFAAAALAIATVLSMVKLYRMPMGGSVTAFSMLFVCIVGWFYGPRAGLLAGVAYGLLQMIFGAYIVSLPQLLIDYPLAFGALGIAGFFHEKKYGLPIGVLAGIVGRFFFSVLSGVVFFAEYAPETMSPLVYSMSYNGAYMFAEAALTLVILFLPPVKKALESVKQQANA